MALLSGATAAGRLPLAAAARRRHGQGRRVAVLGGGVAGLTAAHELVERGFDVTVYERKALGGKARSIPVAGTATGGRRELPGEHGFRFFPGFYHHVPDTMRRIPFPGNENGVYDNFRDARGAWFARDGGREGIILGVAAPEPFTPENVARALVGALDQTASVPPQESAFFIRQLAIFLSSSEERRFGQWEHTSWWDFVQAERMSDEYRRMLAVGITRNLVAAKAEIASTRTVGRMVEAFVYNIMGRGNDGSPDRVLNAPTNEAWIDPWLRRLGELGVRFRVGQLVEKLEIRGGRVVAAQARHEDGVKRSIEADWFVCAVPAERARRLWSSEVLAADPRLHRMDALRTEWMNGIQFYLREPVPIIYGHLSYVDSPWALTSISQAQFWDGHDLPRDYGDGSVRDILSVDVSNWDDPGILYGKPASRCTPAEIAREVWAQMKAHLEDSGKEYLPDEVLHSWFLDPAIVYRSRRPVRTRNDEPLLVNTIGSWENRPGAVTSIPNLFLAADYVRTDIDLATMEGASESARAAVNALLERSGSAADPARMYTLYRPPEFEPLKQADAARFKERRAHAMETPWPYSR